MRLALNRGAKFTQIARQDTPQTAIMQLFYTEPGSLVFHCFKMASSFSALPSNSSEALPNVTACPKEQFCVGYFGPQKITHQFKWSGTLEKRHNIFEPFSYRLKHCKWGVQLLDYTRYRWMCFHCLHLANLYYDSISVDLQKSILLKRNKEQKKSWKCILFTHVEIVRDL